MSRALKIVKQKYPKLVIIKHYTELSDFDLTKYNIGES